MRMRFPAPPGRLRILWTTLILLFLVALVTVRLRASLPTAPGSPTRTVELVYLVPTGSGFDIARSYDGLSRMEMLTATGGRVRDVSVQPGGAALLYSQENEQGGSDLWQADRDGKDAHIVVTCGGQRCTGGVWSSDGHQAAFTRQDSSAARPFLWGTLNGQSRALLEDSSIAGQDFAWSPDGRWLAFSDPAAVSLRLYNLESGDQIVWPAILNGAPSWSPDGRQVAFTSEETFEGFARVRLYVYDLQSTQPPHEVLTGPDGVDISPPQWSPDGEWLLIGQRTLPGSPAKQLFLIRPDGSNYEEVIEDFTATHTAYRWSPDGQQVAFQKFALGLTQNSPELWLWERSSGTFTRIAENAAQPQWLP